MTRKVKRLQKRHGTTTSKYRQTHPITWKPSSPWSGNLWKTTWRSYERFECEFDFLENVHEHHSPSSGSSRKRLRHVNLRFVKNHLWKTTGQLFRETEKLISGQTETTGISLINFQDLRWVSTSSLHSRAYQYSIAKAYVFSDSVLCLGKMGDNPVESWKKQIHWYSDNNCFSEVNRIDGQ